MIARWPILHSGLLAGALCDRVSAVGVFELSAVNRTHASSIEIVLMPSYSAQTLPVFLSDSEHFTFNVLFYCCTAAWMEHSCL